MLSTLFLYTAWAGHLLAATTNEYQHFFQNEFKPRMVMLEEERDKIGTFNGDAGCIIMAVCISFCLLVTMRVITIHHRSEGSHRRSRPPELRLCCRTGCANRQVGIGLRKVSDLWHKLGELCDVFLTKECLNYLQHARYKNIIPKQT